MVKTRKATRSDEESVSYRAAGWVARLRSDDCSSADWARFRAWRGASDENGAAFESAMESWEALDVFAEDPEILQMRLDAMSINKDVSPWPVSLIPLAASFVIVVAVGLLVLLKPSLFDSQVDGDVSIAASDVDVPMANTVPSTSDAADVRFAQAFSSAIGQRSSVDLPDGSSVELNTDTVIEIDFTARRRDLRLIRGEAVFDVAHDAGRPFVVQSGDERVTALGTIFSVRRVGSELVVALIEGSVEVERMAKGPSGDRLINVRLSPGQQARSLASVSEFEVTRVNVDRALSWRTGRLMFDGDRLEDVVAEVNRYSVRKLVLADPSLSDMRLSGAFKAGSAEKFADALSIALPVTVKPLRHGGDLVISADPAPSPSR